MSVFAERLSAAAKAIIEDALRRNRNERSATARELGVHRATLYDLCAKHGVVLGEAKTTKHYRDMRRRSGCVSYSRLYGTPPR